MNVDRALRQRLLQRGRMARTRSRPCAASLVVLPTSRFLTSVAMEYDRPDRSA